MRHMKTLLCLLMPMLLSSCGTGYYCTLTSRGTEPNVKTYYLSSTDSVWATSLEFKEYAQSLKSRLNEKGYVETSPEVAELCILLDYQLGQAYLASSSSNSNTYASTNTTVNGKTSAYGTANATASTQGNKTKASSTASNSTNSNYNVASYGNSSTSTLTQNTYLQPLYVSIVAVDNIGKQQMWEVILNDNVSRESQVASVMPWMFLCAQPYFGTSSNGEVSSRVYNTKKIREQYNLVWPY